MHERSPDKLPVDRYSQLPESTRSWLEKQSEDDLELLSELVTSYGHTKFLGRFFRRIGLAILASVGTAVVFGHQIAEIWTWLKTPMGK